MAEPSGNKLLANRYELRRALGAGGAGMIYQAWDQQLHRFVAVKRVRTLDDLESDRTQTEKLWREAMTLAAIQHPNILTIYDFGVDAEGPYVITEFLDGETLDRVIQQKGPFDRDSFSDAAQQILEGLVAAHQASLIHRDLKSQNIMRIRLASGAWQYKILDFGLARFVTQPTVQSMEGNTSIYGSIFFIAPEQLRHLPLDARTDLYSVGCVFYQMLSGRYPFEGDSIPAVITAHLEHKVKPLHELRPDLPPALCDWVMKLISLDPKDRFASAAEALNALRKICPTSVRTSTIKIVPPRAAPAVPTMPPGPTATLTIRPAPDTTARVRAAPVAPAVRWPAWTLPAAAAILLLALAAGWVWVRQRAAAPVSVEPPAETAVQVTEDIIAWPPYIPSERRALVQAYFDRLKDLDFAWGKVGSILEALAYIQFKEQFNPSELLPLTNITAHDASGKTVGEMDVVLWNVPSNRAEVVFEAVVSDNLRRSKSPAWSQLNRLRMALRDGQIDYLLYPRDPNWKLTPAHFEHARFALLGNQGALAEGYECEVDITRAEAEFLQRQILAFKKKQPAR